MPRKETIRWDVPIRLSDAEEAICKRCTRTGRLYSFLRRHRHELFPEAFQVELADLYACADLVISRAGANVIYELLALKKPHLFIPLSAVASRGDQIINAKHFESAGISAVLNESDLNEQALLDALQTLDRERASRVEKLAAYHLPDAVSMINALIAGA